MARKDICEAPVCKTTKTDTVCTVMVPIYGSTTCRPRSKDEFAPNSFFSVKSGKATVIIGCPKNKYDAKAKRCTVGTRAYQLTFP